MTTQNLLVELFVEELPPKALQKLGDAFASQLAEQLKSQGLLAADSVVTPYASPRRLAAHVTQVAAKVFANAAPSLGSALGGSSSTKSSTRRFCVLMVVFFYF